MATIPGLCDLCRGIFTQKNQNTESYSSYPTFPHHKTSHDLINTALSDVGCQLCWILWNKLSVQEKLLVQSIRDDPSHPEISRITYGLQLDYKDCIMRPPILCTFTFPAPKNRCVIKTVRFYLTDIFSSASHSSQQEHRGHPEVIASVPVRWNKYTGDIASLEWARGWTTKCIQKHSICAPKPTSTRRKLPSRLVWVGRSKNDYLKLCDTQHLPQDTKYMTLSHCWGSKKFLGLTETNIDHLRNEIPLAELPRTFQDAIKVTRFMNISYLWIDSLCIIQDSLKDWQKESLLMRDVYSNTFCTIAATHASDGEQGCFITRGIERPSLEIHVRNDLGSRSYFDCGKYECFDNNIWGREVANSALLQRAWAFQERLLSPRLLHFASSQIFFECRESRACELYPTKDMELQNITPTRANCNNIKAKIYNLLNTAWALQPNDYGYLSRRRGLARTAWTWVVDNFTACELTYETDRLLAIAGVAGEFQPLFNCRYIAGLWEDSLIFQVLWSKNGDSHRTETYQAPSWSWASKIGRTTQMNSVPYDEVFLDDEPEEITDLIKICDVEVTTTDGDPFSQVTDGRLRMKGILIPIMLDFELRKREINVRGVELQLRPDIHEEKLLGRYFCAICLHAEKFDFGIQQDYTRGLLLKHTFNKKGEYERVGLVEANWTPHKLAPLETPGTSDEAERALMTDEFYEVYDEATGEYVFTIV